MYSSSALWIRIRIIFGKLDPDPDPHRSGKEYPDPDLHQSKKSEALEGILEHWRVQIWVKVSGRIRIRFKWKFRSGSGYVSEWKLQSGSASKWKAGSVSLSKWCGSATLYSSTYCLHFFLVRQYCNLELFFWIRLWIRIRMDAQFALADSDSGGQKWLNTKQKEVKKCIVLKCWMFSFEGCRLLL